MPKNPRFKIALYLRSATGDRSSLKSQERQLRKMIALLNAKGRFGKVIGVYADPQTSGMTLARPALRSLNEAVRRREVNLIFMTDPARISRHLGHEEQLRMEHRKHGCAWMTADHPRVILVPSRSPDCSDKGCPRFLLTEIIGKR